MSTKSPRPDRFDQFTNWFLYGSARNKWLIYGSAALVFFVIQMIVSLIFPGGSVWQPWLVTIADVLVFSAFVFWFIFAVLRMVKRSLLQYQTGPASLKNMPWRHLELLTAEIYERLGYKVTDRGLGSDKAKADGGIDIDLRRDGKHWVVQCKKWTGDSVDVDKIRQLHSAMVATQADGAIFVSTSSFTEPAEQWAYDNKIELVDNARLWELVQLARAEERVQELAAPSTSRRMSPTGADGPAPTCAWCGATMQLKQPREGGKQFTPFWGCSNYGRTGCTYKLEMILS